MKIFVSGSSGFIGSAVVDQLSEQTNYTVIAALREDSHNFNVEIEAVKYGDISTMVDWGAYLAGVDVIVHTAACTSTASSSDPDSLRELRLVNTEATLSLARQAASAGVKRFVFISSVKVNGETTQPNSPFTETDLCDPRTSYAISKYEAEQGLKKISEETGLEIVIIRPPMVYGPGVKGNFASLIALVRKGLPLPLGAVDNKRSLIGLDNLIDFIITCIDHPAAGNQTFLVSDGEDLSTTELLNRLASAMGKPSRLFSVPAFFLEFGSKLLGKQAVAQRLLGSLQADISKTKNLLGWQPPVCVTESLVRCVVNLSEKQVNNNNDSKIIRLFDIFFSTIGLFFGFPILLLLTLVGLFDTGSPIFRQNRVGRHQKPFTLVKFRTMKLDTASVASHLASSSSITKFGGFLRKTKLDELPQLWNVLKGEMSLVGPRPCLFNQKKLIREREQRGVYNVRPGITGLAQVNGIDMSTPELLADTDAKMIRDLSIKSYLSYIIQTLTGKGAGDRVKS